VAIAFAAAIPVSGLTVVISDKCGNLSGRLFLGPRSNWSVREQLSGDLSQAKVQKMNGNYDEALSIIDNVLDQVPDFNEALFIKAQILIDGFKDANAAKECISKIFATESECSNLYRWAKNILNSNSD
jgi:hypothetical protein